MILVFLSRSKKKLALSLCPTLSGCSQAPGRPDPHADPALPAARVSARALSQCAGSHELCQPGWVSGRGHGVQSPPQGAAEPHGAPHLRSREAQLLPLKRPGSFHISAGIYGHGELRCEEQLWVSVVQLLFLFAKIPWISHIWKSPYSIHNNKQSTEGSSLFCAYVSVRVSVHEYSFQSGTVCVLASWDMTT